MMKSEWIAFQKSKKFAVRIVNLYRHLCDEHKEYVLSKQLLRSGTSIGANLAEAEFGISDRDYLAKVYISLKESSETLYWLELLYETQYITENEFSSIKLDAEELLKILQTTTKTLSKKQVDTMRTPNSKLQTSNSKEND